MGTNSVGANSPWGKNRIIVCLQEHYFIFPNGIFCTAFIPMQCILANRQTNGLRSSRLDQRLVLNRACRFSGLSTNIPYSAPQLIKFNMYFPHICWNKSIRTWCYENKKFTLAGLAGRKCSSSSWASMGFVISVFFFLFQSSKRSKAYCLAKILIGV